MNKNDIQNLNEAYEQICETPVSKRKFHGAFAWEKKSKKKEDKTVSCGKSESECPRGTNSKECPKYRGLDKIKTEAVYGDPKSGGYEDIDGVRGKVIGTIIKAKNHIVIICQDGTRLQIQGENLRMNVDKI